MDEDRVEAAPAPLTRATGRRAALLALGAAGIAPLAALGLDPAAAKDTKRGRKGRKKNQQQRKRNDGAPAKEVTAQAPPPDVGPPGGLPVQGPTGPTGPAAQAGVHARNRDNRAAPPRRARGGDCRTVWRTKRLVVMLRPFKK